MADALSASARVNFKNLRAHINGFIGAFRLAHVAVNAFPINK